MRMYRFVKLVIIILLAGRYLRMYRQTMNTVKGVGMGLLAGTMVAAIGTRAMNSGHRKANRMKKTAGKAIHTVGDLIGDVEKMLK